MNRDDELKTPVFELIAKDVTSYVPKNIIFDGCSLVLQGKLRHPKVFARNLLDLSTISITTIISQQITERVILNARGNNPSFKFHLLTKVITSCSSSFVMNYVLYKRRNTTGLVIYPLLDGLLSGLSFIIQNRQESQQLLRQLFPELYQNITELINQIPFVTELLNQMQNLQQ